MKIIIFVRVWYSRESSVTRKPALSHRCQSAHPLHISLSLSLSDLFSQFELWRQKPWKTLKIVVVGFGTLKSSSFAFVHFGFVSPTFNGPIYLGPSVEPNKPKRIWSSDGRNGKFCLVFWKLSTLVFENIIKHATRIWSNNLFFRDDKDKNKRLGEIFFKNKS